MNLVLKRLRAVFVFHGGWIALLAAVSLTCLGIAAISTAEYGEDTHLARSQTLWTIIALGLLALCILPHPRQISLASYPLLLMALILLVFVLIPGVPSSIVKPRNGARSWINLYFMNFQPSEMAKIAFVLALAYYLQYRENYRTLRGLIPPFIIMFIPVILILKEPDLGTAMLFPPALFVMLVAAGAKLKHMSILLSLAILAVALNVAAIFYLPDSMQILKQHQRDRITSMISQAQGDTRYIKGIGFQQHKAITLAGAGGIKGYGAERSRIIMRFNHLPEDHNDMIFSVVMNRWGFIGGAATVGLYLLLFLSFMMVAMRASDPFCRIATVGFAGLIFTQAVINITMTIGLMPITGITLPFVSYGGSSLLATYAIVGLVVNFASRRPALVMRPSFEFDEPVTTYR